MSSEPVNMELTPTARPKRKKPNDDSPDIKRMPVDLCGHCGKNCSDKGLNEAIQCDLCEWVHASCEGVSSDDYKLLTNLTSSENVIYYCNLNQCLSRVKQIVFQHFNRTKESSNKTKEISVPPALLSEQQTLRDSVSTLSDKIKSLCINNEQLQSQLNTTISSLSEQAHTASHASPEILSAIDEYMDRERRKSNVIVYGLPEASASTGLECQSCDLSSIQKLVNSEFNISLDTTKCFRLGRRSNKPRPLLILPTEISTRRLILRNAKVVRNSTSFKNVFIAPDLTPQERLQNKQLCAELTRRKESGETNLVIRHGQLIKRSHSKAAASHTNKCFVPKSRDIETNTSYCMFRKSVSAKH